MRTPAEPGTVRSTTPVLPPIVATTRYSTSNCTSPVRGVSLGLMLPPSACDGPPDTAAESSPAWRASTPPVPKLTVSAASLPCLTAALPCARPTETSAVSEALASLEVSTVFVVSGVSILTLSLSEPSCGFTSFA